MGRDLQIARVCLPARSVTRPAESGMRPSDSTICLDLATSVTDLDDWRQPDARPVSALLAATSSSSEDPILAAAQRGDREAIGRWLRRHEGLLRRFARRLCRDDEAAKDVLQESMLAAARSLPQFRGDSPPSSWLFAIARSFHAKQRRRRVGEPAACEPLDELRPELQALADAAPTPDVVVEGRQLDCAITAAIDELDEVQRRVVILRDVEGLTAAEVGAELGISAEAVKARLHRARVALRGRLTPMLEDER